MAQKIEIIFCHYLKAIVHFGKIIDKQMKFQYVFVSLFLIYYCKTGHEFKLLLKVKIFHENQFGYIAFT